MPFYQKRGKIPNKRHIQFRDSKQNLYWEELISRKGFSGIYSNIYHTYPPTAIEAIGAMNKIKLNALDEEHRHRHIHTAALDSKGDLVSSRVPLFFNSDVTIYKSHVTKSMHSLYRNGCADEVLFIHSGNGSFKSNFGNISIKPGDYLVIPRGIIWHIEINEDIIYSDP